MRTRIEIRLELNNQYEHLEIPLGVTLLQLKTMIGEIFKQSATTLPEFWDLKIKNKALNIGDLEMLKDFPVAHGDVFQIVEKNKVENKVNNEN